MSYHFYCVVNFVIAINHLKDGSVQTLQLKQMLKRRV